MCGCLFGVPSACVHAVEDDVGFFEAPPEDREQCLECVCKITRLVYGRRQGARSWQECIHGRDLNQVVKTSSNFDY